MGLGKEKRLESYLMSLSWIKYNRPCRRERACEDGEPMRLRSGQAEKKRELLRFRGRGGGADFAGNPPRFVFE